MNEAIDSAHHEPKTASVAKRSPHTEADEGRGKIFYLNRP
jgi:hypothetical protein